MNKFCANELYSKPNEYLAASSLTPWVEHKCHTPWSLHELTRDHPSLIDYDVIQSGSYRYVLSRMLYRIAPSFVKANRTH